jgi:hypothetical protein
MSHRFSGEAKLIHRTLWIFTLVVMATGIVAGQKSATDGATPLGLAPGAPAGSYPLSGIR